MDELQARRWCKRYNVLWGGLLTGAEDGVYSIDDIRGEYRLGRRSTAGDTRINSRGHLSGCDGPAGRGQSRGRAVVLQRPLGIGPRRRLPRH